MSDDARVPSSIWWPGSPASDLLLDVASVVPVVGAGLSIAAGLPGPAVIAERLLDAAGVSVAEGVPSFFAAADTAYRSGRVQRAELNRIVAEAVDLDAHPDARPTAAHRALVTAHSKLLVTFNYDLLLEAAAEEQGLPYVSLTYRDTEQLTEHLRAKDGRKRLCIYHAHGSAAEGQVETMVLDDAGYRQIANDLRALRALEFLAELNTLCFLGTRLDEPYLQATLLRLPSSHPRHVLVCDDQTALEVSDANARGAVMPTRYGIVTAAFPTGQWHHLDGFAERLAAPRAPRQSLVDLTPSNPPYTRYVEPPIRVRTQDAHSEILAYLELLLPPKHNIALADVARAWRAVIVGPAGSGKSSLIHRLGALQADVEVPVRIPLREVTRFRGAPDELLRHWLRSGTTFGSGEISADARLVLLLDGLDEIDLARQEEAAQTIAALSDAFPQHRFILASRIVPAVRTLATNGFVEFELHPTRAFAEKFLAAHGLELETLIERLAPVGQLDTLGSNPLVLNKLINLVDDLPAGLSDMEQLTWLLEAIVDALCRREAERLAYPVDDLRASIGAVAAAMSLHGLRTLDVTTYPFESGSAVIASQGPEAFAQEAARRLLVWVGGSECAFTERILQSFLAAEHIRRVDPEAQRLLDAFAPTVAEVRRFDQGETTVRCSGLRRDLEGEAALLAATSDAWAERLFERAPAVVARAVPPRAATPPREARAKALLRSLIEPRDERESNGLLAPSIAPTTPSDIAVLAEIVREAPIPVIQARLRRIAQRKGETPWIRGKAIEVLARSGRLSHQLLERLIDDPDIAPQSIAHAVRAMRCVDLIPAMTRRGISTSEHVGSQIIDDVVELMRTPRAGAQVIRALEQMEPADDPRFFWQMAGVVRVHGSEDDTHALWTMIVARHPDALKAYLEAFPRVLVHIGLQTVLPPKGRPRVSASFSHTLFGIVQELKPRDQRAQAFRAELIGDDRSSSRRGRARRAVSAAPADATPESGAPQGSTAVQGSSPPADASSDDNGVPVLMVRSELSDLLRKFVYGLAGKQTVNLFEWVPPELEGQWKSVDRRFSRSDEDVSATDPLMRLEADLGTLPEHPSWSDIRPLVDRCAELPFHVRESTGAQLEQRVADLARDAGTAMRTKLLRSYGSLLALRPSVSEWRAVATDNPVPVRDWLRANVPPPSDLRALLRGSAADEVPMILDSMPAEAHLQVVAEASAVLSSATPRSDSNELGAARICADGAANPDAVLALMAALPDAHPLMSGWAAAAGAIAMIEPAFKHVIDEIRANRCGPLLDRSHVGWVESGLGRLRPGALDVREVLAAFMRLLLAVQDDPRLSALLELVGTTACMVAPMSVAAFLQFASMSLAWVPTTHGLSTLLPAAVEAAHRAAGSRAAGIALGISLGELHGQRALNRISFSHGS